MDRSIVPTFRLHKAVGQALVVIDCKSVTTRHVMLLWRGVIIRKDEVIIGISQWAQVDVSLFADESPIGRLPS